MIAATPEALKQGMPELDPRSLGNSTKPKQALRYNQGKPKLSYILSAPHAIEGVAAVMDFGAKKYEKDNWKKGLPFSEVLDSLLRHASSFADGENLDKDSGLPHADHILCNALFLAEFIRIRTEFDDRPSRVHIKPETASKDFLADEVLRCV